MKRPSETQGDWEDYAKWLEIEKNYWRANYYIKKHAMSELWKDHEDLKADMKMRRTDERN